MISFKTAGRYGAERHQFEPGPLPIIFISTVYIVHSRILSLSSTQRCLYRRVGLTKGYPPFKNRKKGLMKKCL